MDTAAVNALIAAAILTHAGMADVHHPEGSDGPGGGLDTAAVNRLINEALRPYATSAHVGQEILRALLSFTNTVGMTSAIADAITAHAALPNVHHTPPTGPGGGFPTTRTQVFSASASGTSQNLTASEAWLPNQLYEILLGSRTRLLFLTVAAGSHGIQYLVPDIAFDTTAPEEPAYLFAQLVIGQTTVQTFGLQEEASGASVSITINKLT